MDATADAIDPTWVPVARWDEVPEGSGWSVVVAGRPVALWRLGDRVVALDGHCPHQGANLALGAVDAAAGTVTCPRRGCLRWRFDLATGASVAGLPVRCRTYPVRFEGGLVLVGWLPEA